MGYDFIFLIKYNWIKLWQSSLEGILEPLSTDSTVTANLTAGQQYPCWCLYWYIIQKQYISNWQKEVLRFWNHWSPPEISGSNTKLHCPITNPSKTRNPCVYWRNQESSESKVRPKLLPLQSLLDAILDMDRTVTDEKNDVLNHVDLITQLKLTKWINVWRP